ncbi:MAG: hypothetical protein H6618_06520 [Deltaproteobacteria bacterium]|nr:hypothetical protein [Deltaproteobacteria bacterium]
MFLSSAVCYHCQNRWHYDPPMSRRAVCPNCGQESRVCLNCSYYEPNAFHECRESQAEWVRDKEQGNFCGYFQSAETQKGFASSEEEQSRRDLEKLFGSDHGSLPPPMTSPEDLFRKK